MRDFTRQSRLAAFLKICAFCFVAVPQAQAMESELWQKLQAGEAVALMRHAIAPGNGDPANFLVNDCSTQRNLSEEGKLQAARIGELFKSNGVRHANVFSSQWCRCVDTANGLDLGANETLPLLNSFYQDRSTEQTQTAQLKNWIEDRLKNADSETQDHAELGYRPAILVSHQVNITSLTGVYPASGEVVLIGFKDGQIEVLGTVETN